MQCVNFILHISTGIFFYQHGRTACSFPSYSFSARFLAWPHLTRVLKQECLQGRVVNPTPNSQNGCLEFYTRVYFSRNRFRLASLLRLFWLG